MRKQIINPLVNMWASSKGPYMNKIGKGTYARAFNTGDLVPPADFHGFGSQSGVIKGLIKGVTPFQFARATTGSVTDWEGLERDALVNEARVEYGRRVENLFTDITKTLAVSASTTAVSVSVGTFVFSMGAGTGTATFSGTATGSTGTLIADGSNRTAETLTITVAGTIIVTASVADLSNIQLENVTGQSNQNPGEYVSVGVGTENFSLDAASTWQSTDANITHNSSTDAWDFNGSQANFSLVRIQKNGSVWVPTANKTFVVTWTISNRTSGRVQLGGPDPTGYTSENGTRTDVMVGDGVSQAFIQCDNTAFDGSVIINSVAYVDHGVNVDGVKVFDYLNGNTVSSNVVTESKGDTLGSDVLGSDRDLSGWDTSLVTLGDTVTAYDGATLTNNGLVMDNNEGIFEIDSTVSLTAGVPYRYHFLAKAGAYEWVRAQIRTQPVNNYQFFHLSGSGALGATWGGSVKSEITALANGWYLCLMTVYETTTNASRGVRIQIAEADDDYNISTAGGSSGIYVDFPQVLIGLDDWSFLYESFAATNYADTDNDLTGGAETVDLTTPGTGDYTLSVRSAKGTVDAAVTVAAGTATGTGFGQATQDSPVTFNLSVAGTVTLTLNSGTLETAKSGWVLKQVEQGTVATSFIQASGGNVTRTADNGEPSFDYANWSQTEGTWYADVWFGALNTGGPNGILALAAGPSSVLYEQNGEARSNDGGGSSVVVLSPSSPDNRFRFVSDFGTGDTLEVGMRDVNGLGDWAFDDTPKAYDGGFISADVMNIAFQATVPLRIRDLYGYTTRKGKDWIIEKI